jgi:hypothetical protein
MIVFPLSRSVGLKAATASSRGAMVADVRPQASVRTRWTISLSWARSASTTKSIARPSRAAPRAARRRSPAFLRLDQACGPLLDVAADDVEHQVDSPTSSRASLSRSTNSCAPKSSAFCTVGGASGADDVGAGLACELRHHRPDCAGRAVREDALARLKAAVLEQSLPRGQP